MTESILEVQNLKVEFEIENKRALAVDDVSFSIAKGKFTGLVGESGCGKSVSAFSILRLIPRPPGHFASGRIQFKNQDLLALPIEEMRKIRGRQIAMIFQEPLTALNPVYNVGRQMIETFLFHFPMKKSEAWDRSIQMLEKVGIPSPIQRMKDYPHQLSGGMRQRVMIAMALSCSPQLLLADEPTTALDVTIQAQILDLLEKMKEEYQMSTLLITHDLGVVAETCKELIVMYAGKVVESGSVEDVFEFPLHPYTKGLLDSIPKGGITKSIPLPMIEGMVPDISVKTLGCRFADRCSRKKDRCLTEAPLLQAISPSRQVSCHFHLGLEIKEK